MYDTNEVARVLQLTPRTIRLRCQEGEYPNARKSGRKWLVSAEDLPPWVVDALERGTERKNKETT